jgi:hypothetical protein
MHVYVLADASGGFAESVDVSMSVRPCVIYLEGFHDAVKEFPGFDAFLCGVGAGDTRPWMRT